MRIFFPELFCPSSDFFFFCAVVHWQYVVNLTSLSYPNLSSYDQTIIENFLWPLIIMIYLSFQAYNYVHAFGYFWVSCTHLHNNTKVPYLLKYRKKYILRFQYIWSPEWQGMDSLPPSPSIHPIPATHCPYPDPILMALHFFLFIITCLPDQLTKLTTK